MSPEKLHLRARVAFPEFELDVAEELPLDGVTVLFGPSGSGKSTLLRVIAGFQAPDEGRIALGAQQWLDTSAGLSVQAHRRPVGFLFQDARLFPHLDVAGNLGFAEKRRRRSSEGFQRAEVVDALDLGPLLGRRTDALSGGERQRVALGRTLLSNPALLLLDEPLSALDIQRKAEILPYLEALPRRFGVPTIYVTHSLDEVVQLADQMLVLSAGRVQAYGPAAATIESLDLQSITGRFEAGVLLEARVTGHDERTAMTRVDLEGQTLKMPRVNSAEEGDPVRLRIRARDVALAIRRPEGVSIRNVLSGRISEILPQKDTPFVEVFVAVGEVRIHARITRDAVEDLSLKPGMEIFALVKSVSFDQRPQ